MNYIDSIENMRKCIDVFIDYMYKTFNIDVVNSFPQTNPRRILFETIQQIKEKPEFANLPISKLNNIVLNKVRDFYVQNYNLIHSKRPQQRQLDRETNLFGKRPVVPEIPLPMNTSFSNKNDTEIMYDKMLHARKGTSEGNVPQLPMPTISENKIDMNEFQRKLDELQKQRELNAIIPEDNENPYFRESRLLHQNHLQQQPYDPQNFYKNLTINPQNVNSSPDIRGNPETTQLSQNSGIDTNNIFPNQLNVPYSMSDNPVDNIINKSKYKDMQENPLPVPVYTTPATKTLQSEPEKTIISPYNYIVLNGYDRDWIRQTLRFQFSVEMTLLTKTYKNIHEIAFTKLIIPSEIINEKTVENPNPKRKFNHSYRLSVPYLTLQIDEINDVCDGINQVNQKAFTHFIQDCTYCTENGRGYTILKPLQDEKKIFHPTPLASLPKMSVSITRPNGSLFNYSRDKYHIWKIEYDEYNRKHLKVILDKYFDKNEFFKGDIVYIKKFMMPKFDKDSEDIEENPAYQEYLRNSYTYNRIMDFINRQEGHDVLELGKPNDDGYYRNFTIHAPGEFDTGNGRFVIDKQMVDLIQKFNEDNFPQVQNTTTTGYIINTSLQPILSMQIRNTKGDANEFIQPQLI